MDVDLYDEDTIGQGLIRERYLTHDQVEEVLKIQRTGDERLFGEIAVDLEFIDDSSLREYIQSKRRVGILV